MRNASRVRRFRKTDRQAGVQVLDHVTRPVNRRLMLQLMAAASVPPLLTTLARGQQRETGQADARPWNADTFDEVWRTVRDGFYDPHLHGLDWNAVGDRYRREAALATSRSGLAKVINGMLSELHASHTQFYTPDETAYYQLAGIFAGRLRRRGLDRAFPGNRISYPGIGVFTRDLAPGTGFVTGVIDGTPAKKAGLAAGDEILSADGAPFEQVGSFRGKVGKQVSLAVRRAGATSVVPVTVADLEPGKMFLDGMNASARIVEANGRRIGYVHIWSYASYTYQRALEHLLSDGVLKDADALVWDLRDGWGGAVPEYLDLFNTRAPTMKVTDHDGDTEFENFKWRKPVAMLVNGGTRSGKEVLAYGFKKYRIGEVIGTRTEGAVLAATSFLIGDGLLLLAVEDVLVDGERLERVGVTPTVEVQTESPSGTGGDPQLDRARRRCPGFGAN
jgi:carboxyl-terminal processing protease